MIDTSILIKRKIIKNNQDISNFFDEISSKIFTNPVELQTFSALLKTGHVALSTSAYTNLKDPKSAIALKLDENKSNEEHINKIEQYIQNGVGIGFNLSKFKNPIDVLICINKFMKNKEPNLNRLPAGIALLNINHPKIIDFITLKDKADYENWCFNLSVVIDDEFFKTIDNNNIYDILINSMMKSGEPGIIFSNEKDFICDCCAASKLEENQGLTIAHINLSNFYNNSFDFGLLSRSANILSLALKNIAPDGFISILGYQDLLNKINFKYGSKKALELLENCLKTIKLEANKHAIKMCISPSGATSRILKTTPSIEPDFNSTTTYFEEIDTMKIAQKYLEGGISKTINLKKTPTVQDIDAIIRYSKESNLKGITVFPAQ